MNKSELIQRLAKRVGISVSVSRHYLNILLEEMEDELANDNSVDFHAFGSLRPWHQTERLGRNPKNGVPCSIHKRTSIKFRPGSGLLKRLNSVLFLFLLIATGCTSELPADSHTPHEEWFPVEIAAVRISDMEIAEMGLGGKTKSMATLPGDVLIQTEDDLKNLETQYVSLHYTLNGENKVAELMLNGSVWSVVDADTYDPLMLPRHFSGTITARISEQNSGYYEFNDMRATCRMEFKNDKWALTIPFEQVTTGVMVDVSGVSSVSRHGLRITLKGKNDLGNNKEFTLYSKDSRLYHYIFLATPIEKDMTLKIELVQTGPAIATKEISFTSNELSASTKNNNGDFYTINLFATIDK